MTAASAARVARRFVARDFPSDKALKNYLQEHPGADKSKHHVTEHGEKGHGEGHDSGSMLSRLKGALKGVAGKIKDLPKEAQQFVADSKHRKEALGKGVAALKKAPKKYASSLVKVAKHEAHEFKEAGKGLLAVMDGEKPTPAQKKAIKAVSIHMGITVAAAVLATASPALAAAAVGKAMGKHMALKAATDVLGDLHVLEELGHVGHGIGHVLKHVLHHVKLAAEDGDDDKKASPEEMLAVLVMKHVAEQMKDIDDDTLAEALGGDDEEEGQGQAKQARILKVSTSSRVAFLYLAKEFSSPEQLREYLKEHPKADPRKHHVEREDGGLGSGAARVKVKVDKSLAGDIEKIWKNKPSSGAVSKVKNMIERGDPVSANMLGQADLVLKNEEHNAEGDRKKAIGELRKKLKSQLRQ